MTRLDALSCADEVRRSKLWKAQDLIGLDYVEVGDDARRLRLYFIGHIPEQLTAANVRIEGGERIRDIRAGDVLLGEAESEGSDDWITVVVDRVGDFSTYTLRIVALDADGKQTAAPFPGLDPRYASVDFSFLTACPSGLDCGDQPPCPPETWPAVEIDYLAKDYESLRQLILDRLTLQMPQWRERHAADLTIALAEMLAYTGDELSYFQDAVATEAYLGTARQRVSVRRHARLLDYRVHEGCNARAFVHLSMAEDQSLPAGAFFLTRHSGEAAEPAVLSEDQFSQLSVGSYEVFEPMKNGQAAKLRRGHNRIPIYAWGQRQCCLASGATRATLLDEATGASAGTAPTRALQLEPGDLLLFEEVLGPRTGQEADANPRHRQVVRLTHVTPAQDPLTARLVLDVEWHAEDALAFPLCLSATTDPPDCAFVEDVSVARGNLLVVDHGRRRTGEHLGRVPDLPQPTCEDIACGAEPPQSLARFSPTLARPPLTYSQALPATTPAARCLLQNPRSAAPTVVLHGTLQGGAGPVLTEWSPLADLLESGPEDLAFVVETDNLGVAHIRFGEGKTGRSPEPNTLFAADYRAGNGHLGNVGAEALAHVIAPGTNLSGIQLVRNPLPAQGGTDPEPVGDVKKFAPHLFKDRIERAVTADDYAQLALRDPRLLGASSSLEWNGSWYEATVGLQVKGREGAPRSLLESVEKSLHRYRRVGHDLETVAARYVSLDLAIEVCVRPGIIGGHVKRQLLELFSNRPLPGGGLGIFHPDRLAFGQPVEVSRLTALAQAVPGVQVAAVTKLRRLYEEDHGELAAGVLRPGPHEIVRLDNDPSLPENGRLKIDIRGGR